MPEFFEDFRRIILNTRQELILIRRNTYVNALISPTDKEVTKLYVPNITFTHALKLKFLQYIEYPVLKKTMKYTWTVKAANKLVKPSFVNICFKITRKDFIGEACQSLTTII